MGMATEQNSKLFVQPFIHFNLFDIKCQSLIIQSSEGNALLHYMGVATEQLSPPHNYVPWIVVDGVHNEQIGKQM